MWRAFNSLLGILPFGNLIFVKIYFFQLPSWDTVGSSSAGRFGFVFQLPSWDTIEGQMGKFGYTIFQLPSWDTHPKVGRTLGAWDRLSTPFLGDRNYLLRLRGMALLSTPFLGYRLFQSAPMHVVRLSTPFLGYQRLIRAE